MQTSDPAEMRAALARARKTVQHRDVAREMGIHHTAFSHIINERRTMPQDFPSRFWSAFDSLAVATGKAA